MFQSMQQIISRNHDRIFKHPFNEALRKGTLPIETFYYFLEQDKEYLKHYGQSLSILANRVDNELHRYVLMQMSHNVFTTEYKLHEKYLSFDDYNFKFFNPIKRQSHPINPAFSEYIRHIVHAAEFEPIPVALASLMPCFIIYAKLGFDMQQKGIANGNPHLLWIKTYTDIEFVRSGKLMIEIFQERTKVGMDKQHRRHIIQTFAKSMNCEIACWDSACWAKAKPTNQERRNSFTT